MHRHAGLKRCGCALAVALATLCLGVPPAFAWGPRGHRIVAELAAARLTPQAAAGVRRPLAVRGERNLADVANWADHLRDVDPALYRRTKRLHFVNFHSGDCNYDPPRDCRDGECAVAAIHKYSAILADRAATPQARAEALAFVVHFVGDVHQPLHADYRHDAGGNDFQVRWRVGKQNRGTNLHRVWDSLMLDSAGLSTDEYVRKLAAQHTRIAIGGTPAEWAEESCRLDRDGEVYPTSNVVDPAYVDRELPVAEQRLRQAGARLAALLNRDLEHG